KLGYALLGAGDLDVDGIGDLLVSRVRQEGEVAFFPLGDVNGTRQRDACEPCAAPIDIDLGMEVQFRSTRIARRRCFRFVPPRGAALRLRLAPPPPDDQALLVLRWGVPPEPGLLDLEASGAASANPGLIVSSAPGDRGYVTVQSGLFNADSDMSLLVEVLPLPTLVDM